MEFLELIVLVFVVVTAVSIIWSTLQTGISPMMSSGKARKAMLASLDIPVNGPLIDLGSGWNARYRCRPQVPTARGDRL